jgi:DNA-binding winged helix-turn-helix (wHTH) protein
MGDAGFRFGAFELDTANGRLCKHGAHIKLQTKPLQILEALVSKPGELITREELFGKLWPTGTFVDFESGLNTATNRLRAALGDSAGSARYLETVPRLGYRFICPVTVVPAQAPVTPVLPPPARSYRPLSLAASALAILIVFTWIHLNATAPGSQPSLRQLTFRAGVVQSARFVPGSNNAVYTVTGEGDRPRTRMVALDSVSVADGTRDADSLPDGSSLALVRRRGVESLVEFPAGHVVYASRGWIDSLRVSPSGDRAAFFEHPVRDDDGGSLLLVDKQRHVAALTHKWSSAGGVAWARSGKEIWFSASPAGFARSIYAVSMAGRLRKISNSPFSLQLFDISRDGRALIALDDMRVRMTAQFAGDEIVHDVSNFDCSHVDDIARDGRLILFTEASSAVGAGYAAYTLDRESHRAVRFASGRALALSPDGKSALTIDPEDRGALTLTSLATGASRKILGGGFEYQWAKFLPARSGQNRETLLVGGAYPIEPLVICKQSLDGGTPVAISNVPYMDYVEVSPDGSRLAGITASQLHVFDLRSGKSQPILAGERALPVAWSADGEYVYAALRGEKPDRIIKANLRSGQREIWETIGASGARLASVVAAPEAGAFAYSTEFNLSRLYLVAGWS